MSYATTTVVATQTKLGEPPAGVKLNRYFTYLGVSTTLTNASGYVIGTILEGGQVTGTVRWIVATPEGVQIGVEGADKTWKVLLFTASGYAVLA